MSKPMPAGYQATEHGLSEEDRERIRAHFAQAWFRPEPPPNMVVRDGGLVGGLGFDRHDATGVAVIVAGLVAAIAAAAWCLT